MARYYDLNILAELIKARADMLIEGKQEYYHIAGWLDKLPSADVAEVKHGEWRDRYNNKHDNHLYECSACGGKALYEFYENELGQTKLKQVLSNYCPNCGAKMDGSNK